MNTTRVLSLDGGGIRGVVTLVWLAELEKQLDNPLHTYFDLIIGTSTGAIIGCGLSSGYDASTMLDMYIENGKYIFDGGKNRLWNKICRFFSDGLSSPSYSGEGLRLVMDKVFGKKTLKDLNKPTMVTSYNLRTGKPLIFKSFNNDHENLSIAQVCKASASAPTFFPAEIMKINGEECPILDGGVVSNNPSLCGLAEAFRLYGTNCDNLLLSSFGTGEAIREVSTEESQEWGKLEWAIPIIDVLFDGSSAVSDYICNKVLSKENYYRFQTEIGDDNMSDMDNCDQENMNNLYFLAMDYLKNGGYKKIKELAKRLSE